MMMSPSWRIMEVTMALTPHNDNNLSPTPKLLSLKAVLEKIPYCRAHIYRMEAKGDFPRRVQIGKRRIGWWETDIQGWLSERPYAEPRPDDE
ncbi:helix-turn-helix transcriptional regulator [Devosia sp. CAU 1758]